MGYFSPPGDSISGLTPPQRGVSFVRPSSVVDAEEPHARRIRLTTPRRDGLGLRGGAAALREISARLPSCVRKTPRGSVAGFPDGAGNHTAVGSIAVDAATHTPASMLTDCANVVHYCPDGTLVVMVMGYGYNVSAGRSRFERCRRHKGEAANEVTAIAQLSGQVFACAGKGSSVIFVRLSLRIRRKRFHR